MKNLFDHYTQSGLKFWKKLPSDGITENPCLPTEEFSLPIHPSFPTSFLKDFVENVTRKKNPVILDVGRVIGSNIEFFLNLGIKVYLEDLLAAYVRPEYSVLTEEQSVWDDKNFFSSNFLYGDNYFDGLICWDVLDYVDPRFAKTFVERVYAKMKPESFVLAFFHTSKGPNPAPIHKYRVLYEARLEHIPLELKLEIRKVYQTRDINQLFSEYQSQKFCLLKHNMLEVLLKKP
jgi:hypothetical protein